jgi:23S rRNA (cytosine1962-C5)-methyltransferase
MFPKVIIKNDKLRSIQNRHPWIYPGSIDQEDMSLPPGSVVDVTDQNGRFLARGFYNPHSDIRVRIFTFDPDIILNQDYFISIFKKALALREKYIDFSKTNMFRLIHGEGDECSGLVIDLYNNVAVISTYSYGYYVHLTDIISALRTVFSHLKGIFLKNESLILVKEGLEQEKMVLWGDVPEDGVSTLENGLTFIVDIHNGQKTGMFIDQRDNRRYLGEFSKNRKRVLNCFSYSGGFSLYAAVNGIPTTSVDISEKAIEMAKRNFKANGIDLSNHTFLAADVFDVLHDIKPNDYDIIVLDPPAFAKKPSQVKKAKRGYKEINLRAIQKIENHGLLLSCSCSHYIYRDMLQKIIYTAALDANRTAKILMIKGQPYDHPINIYHPEGDYLKAFYLHIHDSLM